MSRTITVRGAVDAYTDQDNAAANYGGKSFIRLNESATHVNRGLLGFPLRLPEDAVISSATLYLHTRGTWAGETATVRRVTERWREDRVTYNTVPLDTATGAATSATITSSGGDQVSFNVTTIVQAWVNGKSNYGFSIRQSGSAADRSFHSSEAADHSLRPYLEVTYSRTPDAPTNLTPSGGQAVADSTPVLTWDSVTPSEVYIQADDDPAFGTPLWDTGFVSWTDLDYDTAALTALTNNTTYYWRVKVKNGDGVASDWSDAAEFEYRTQGTLSISAPSGSTVTTPRPTITWSLTGRTQASYRVRVHEDGVLVHDTKRVASTSTSYTLPAGVLDDGGASYDFTVMTWDTFDRVSVGSSPAWAIATKTGVTLTTGATTAPTGVTATSDGAMGITIGWTRATAPDAFVITRGNKVVADDIDPADALVSGTTYSWTVFRGNPWTGSSDTWGVQAETGGIVSVKATTTFEYQPRGIGLVDEETGTQVRLLGQEAIQASIGEAGATYFPLGARRPVRIVDSVRGLEGSVTGDLVSWASTTPSTALGALYDLYERSLAGVSLRLIAGRWNIPVEIGSLIVDQSGTGEERYRVSFQFWQTGEYDVRVEV